MTKPEFRLWPPGSPERVALNRDHVGVATSADFFLLARAECQEANDSLPPSAPANGRQVDGFHAGCCAIRAIAWMRRGEAALAPERDEAVKMQNGLRGAEEAVARMLDDVTRERDGLQAELARLKGGRYPIRVRWRLFLAGLWISWWRLTRRLP